MKNISAVVFAFCLTLVISSCMKNHDMSMLNIDYPAAYVVNGTSNNISVIRLSDNTVTETISLNGATFPHHIYISPDKTKLAVAITGMDLSGGHGGHGSSVSGYKIQIINTVTGMIEKEIPLPKMAHNAIFSPDGTELWLGQSDSIESTVRVYRVSDWQLTDTIIVGSYLSEVTFIKGGGYAIATNTGSNSVHMIFPDSKNIQCETYTNGTSPVGTWQGTLDYSYADNEVSQTIAEIDLQGDSTKALINLGFTPGYAAYKTSNDELWVSDATNGRVVIFTNSAGTWTQMHTITTGANAHAITFNADESLAYVSNQDAGTVSVINTATHTKTKDITVGQKPNGIVLKQ